MIYVALALAAVLAVFAIRLAMPGDLRVNKRYIGQFLQDSTGKGPVKIKSERLDVLTPVGLPEERVYYNLEAEFQDGTKREVLVHIFYPLEVFYAEREKNSRAAQQDEANMSSMTDISAPSTSSDIERFREDPFKDLSEEEKTKQAKQRELAAEIRQLGLLTQEPSVYPEVLNFDMKLSIVIAEPVGTDRLDKVLLKSSADEQEMLLSNVVRTLARLHIQGEAVAGLLMPGVAHSDAMILSQTMSACETWGQLGVGFTPTETQELLDAVRPLYEEAVTKLGPKMGEASPRSFFVRDGLSRSVEWGRARRDVSGLDLAELLGDPIVKIPLAAEKRLMALYIDELGIPPENREKELVKLMRLATYYRFVLIGFLINSRQALTQMSAERRKSFERQLWPADALSFAILRLQEYLADDEGLADLRAVVSDKLERLAKA